MRLPKQVLIIPYRIRDGHIEFCIFKRSDMKIWQFIAGGAEDFDADIEASAKRELFEETGIEDIELEQLEMVAKIPVVNVVKDFMWGEDVFYSEEFAFAANIEGKDITLSHEHEEYKWVDYLSARSELKYDSNKSALWEINEKLIRRL